MSGKAVRFTNVRIRGIGGRVLTRCIISKKVFIVKQNRNGNFINVFVNEMYAILIGIGIANVLFREKLDLSNGLDVAMALFVTAVVLLYWWDWTEYIASNVVASKVEFAIDFALLVCLELLFGHFDKPGRLSQIFVAIAVVDVLWVLHHVTRSSLTGRRKSRRWIEQKVLALALYSLLCATLLSVGESWPRALQAALVMGGFVLARVVGFRELKDGQVMVRRARPADAPALVEINNSLLVPGADKGFFLFPFEEKQLREEIESEEHLFFVAEIVGTGVVGFIKLSAGIDQEVLDQLRWDDESSKAVFLSRRSKYIDKIGVKNGFRGNRIGATL